MRPAQEFGFAPVTEKDRQELLHQHIPYRVQLFQDGAKRIPAQGKQDNQAFEAGAISGRILLSFLGVGYDEKRDRLKEDRQHKSMGGITDDVKVRDVGGHFVNLDSLSAHEKEALSRLIHGANKACAHFTVGSDHRLDVATYKQAVTIIVRLLRECLPNESKSEHIRYFGGRTGGVTLPMS